MIGKYSLGNPYPVDKNGYPKISKADRDSKDRNYHNLAYVTTTEACPNACSFCRNENMEFGEKPTTKESLAKAILSISPWIHTMTFGGGEPLLVLPQIYDIMCNLNYKARKTELVTSGVRDPFLSNLKKLGDFSHIYLSRLKAGDAENQKAFKACKPLLTLPEIPDFVKDGITVLTTCFKNGGVASAEEMLDMVQKMQSSQLNRIVFNNLQKNVSNTDYYHENNIPNSEFEIAKRALVGKGFEKTRGIVYSGGYTIETFKKNSRGFIEPCVVRFKRYHEHPEETKALWKKAQKRSYDFSVSPNGEIFGGLCNKQKLEI